MKLSILLLVILSLISCNATNKIGNNNDIVISLTNIDCGSYAVSNNGVLIGYVVKPFWIDVQNKEIHIARFENLLKTKYFSFYDKLLRVYSFSKNGSGDTTLLVDMLSIRQTKLIPDWQCKTQTVEVLNSIYIKRKYPSTFWYNCSKSRFRMPGDLD